MDIWKTDETGRSLKLSNICFDMFNCDSRDPQFMGPLYGKFSMLFPYLSGFFRDTIPTDISKPNTYWITPLKFNIATQNDAMFEKKRYIFQGPSFLVSMLDFRGCNMFPPPPEN